MVAAYKDTGYDTKKSLEMIDQKRQKKAQEATQGNQIEETTKKDDDMHNDDIHAWDCCHHIWNLSMYLTSR